MTSNSQNLRRLIIRDNWEWRQTGQSDWLSAIVPGSNFLDLQRHQKIDDPFYRDNEQSVQWLEHEGWEYRCKFELEESDIREFADLVFEGLDTYATVWLNDQELLSCDNMFRTYRVDCHEHLIPGTNILQIVFRSPIAENRHKFEGNKFTYPAENDRSVEKLSVYARKAPYHFGWDWGPRLVCSGIWRDVSLELYDQVRISTVNVTTESIDQRQARLLFDVSFEGQNQFDGVLEVRCLTPESGFQGLTREFKSTSDSVTFEIELQDPKLWWPNGLGAAFLYDFEVIVMDKSGAIDRKHLKIGVRTIEVVNEKDADDGAAAWTRMIYFMS